MGQKMNIKVIAMYLPQFHRTPENDKWWGEGFTEWTAVKKAKSLYEGHKQPRIPLNENYYNLLDHDVMAWQSGLMKKYEVDGMCMYHYWFKDGRKILEKPAENLLNWKDIPMPFCFCWANETWARSWSNIPNKNVWADTYERGQTSCENGILLKQGYGDEQQWKEHFYYLLPFFRDERYIKVDGRPLFLLYKAEDVSCLAEMLDCWRSLCRSCGLPDLYVIGSGGNTPGRGCMDAGLHYQPARSRGRMPKSWQYVKNGMTILEYDDVWTGILGEDTEDKIYLEGVVGYDDTPRRGKSGCIIEHSTPEKFAYYLTELLAKSAARQLEMVFLNAWNEWGEGMYLEPDKEYGEKFLEAIPTAKRNYTSRISKYAVNLSKSGNTGQIDRMSEAAEKDRYYLHVLDNWMTKREKGFSIVSWMEKKKLKRIAVYGYGIFGKHLCSELYGSGIQIEYIIDQRKNSIQTGYCVYLPSDTLPKVDAVVVTAIYEYDRVYRKLKDKGIHKIFPIEAILNGNEED